MLSIAAEGTLVGGYEVVSESQGEDNGAEVDDRELVRVETLAPDSTIGEPIEGPDPSAQEDARSRKTPPRGSTSKRPITRLQKKEELESVLRKSKKKKKKRRLVKDGKVVNEKILPLALVVDVDDEVEEEPGSLVGKPSKKLTGPKPKRESSMSEKELRKVEGEKSGEKEDEKVVEESCERIVEESAEKISRKSVEKGKSIRNLVKRKADASDEPSSCKKTKVGDTQDAGKEKLKNQKWTHLFTNDSPKVYEEEVRSLYADLFTIENDHICMIVNGVDFVMDSAVLGTILGVPTEGMSSIQGTYSLNFRNAILKDQAVQQGERVQKNALFPVYQLLFELVNKDLLPRAERRSITSRADLVLMEALDGYTTINLLGIMIEHMLKVAEFKDGNHGLPYGFLLTKVFEFFKVPLGKAKVGTRKQTFSKTTLEECECIAKSAGVGSTSTISQLINAQNSAIKEIRKLKARNAILEGQLSQVQEAPGSSSSQSTKVAPSDKGEC
ncbi:PREDICTED: uncharacterized protein LOC109233870 [Nicotiana attenuata]|uniref:uncharacterized protein LOC109233870 n=1 Tax=Nicotiana attenuata TaxID=49451 RepID=UPI000904A18D|nr:PREDICTED: uncharacterized protein LOC109233870 [Nicotiana attenuata]